MLFDTQTFTLRDGRSAVLRSPRLSDAQAMLSMMRDTAGETEFLLRYPEECCMTVAMEEDFILQQNNAADSMMILCEVDGTLAGSSQVRFHPLMKTCHRAEIAIAIRQAFWRLGIGTALIEAMAEAARQRGAMLLELEVIQSNARARALYEKLGFQAVCLHPEAIRLKDGTMLGEYIMQRRL